MMDQDPQFPRDPGFIDAARYMSIGKPQDKKGCFFVTLPLGYSTKYALKRGRNRKEKGMIGTAVARRLSWMSDIASPQHHDTWLKGRKSRKHNS